MLFDSGEHDGDRVFVFGIVSSLVDLVKYKGWACVGTFKCSAVIYYQLYRLHPEEEMATYSSTLAWKIPWMEKPGRLQSMGLQRIGDN